MELKNIKYQTMLLNNNSKKSINEILKKHNTYKLKRSFNTNADFSFDLNTHVHKFYQEIWDLFNFFKALIATVPEILSAVTTPSISGLFLKKLILGWLSLLLS